MNINNDEKKFIIWTHIHITVVGWQMSFLSQKNKDKKFTNALRSAK